MTSLLWLSYLNFSPRYRIGPFEVESALIQHPAVSESAVVSSPDPIRGEVKIRKEMYLILSIEFSAYTGLPVGRFGN